MKYIFFNKKSGSYAMEKLIEIVNDTRLSNTNWFLFYLILYLKKNAKKNLVFFCLSSMRKKIQIYNNQTHAASAFTKSSICWGVAHGGPEGKAFWRREESHSSVRCNRGYFFDLWSSPKTHVLSGSRRGQQVQLGRQGSLQDYGHAQGTEKGDGDEEADLRNWRLIFDLWPL